MNQTNRLTDQQAEQLAEQKQQAEQETTGCAACDKVQERTGRRNALCKTHLHEYLTWVLGIGKANDNSRT